MGKLKQALIVADEVAKAKANREVLKVPLASRDQWVSYGMENQQDWSEYQKEFEAWLDAYEASFGSYYD